MSNTLLQHVFAGERLQAFSDAVFSIIATIMVIPLKLEPSEARSDDFDLHVYLLDEKTLIGIGIYVYSFILVIDAWYSHCRVFKLVEKVDDIITLLNLLILLTVGFLPATIRLVHTFGNDPIVFTLACGNIILISAEMCAVLFYAFRQQGTLHPELSQFANIRLLKTTMYFPLLINPILAVLSIIFAWSLQDLPGVAAVFFFSTGGLAFLGRFLMWKIQKERFGGELPKQCSVLMQEVVSWQRTLAFSDGVFAIVATLILLDLTTENIPQISSRTPEDLLRDTWGSYITYVSSFIFIGLFWLIHHNTFEYIKSITSLLTMFNTLTLLLVGGLPFAVGVVGVVTTGNNVPASESNVSNAVRVLSTLMVIIGSSQLILWTCAHLQKAEVLSPLVNSDHFENLHLCKLLIFPFIGIIAYLVTYSYTTVAHHFFGILVIVAPVLFILPNLFYNLFKWIIKKKRPWMFDESNVYQIQKSGTAANEASVLLHGSNHNTSLAPSAVTTTTAVLDDEEDEEDMDKSAVSRQQRSHSDTTVV